MSPPDWLAWYERHADAYAAATQVGGPTTSREAFIAALKPGARVVDVGCGAGRDLKAFCEKGLDACGVDASARLASHARRVSRATVHVAHFESWVSAPERVGRFDGVWACALLVHTPCSELKDAFASLMLPLKVGGVFWASVRAGAAGRSDARGRYACGGDAVRVAAEQAGLGVICLERQEDGLPQADNGIRPDWWVLWAERVGGGR